MITMAPLLQPLHMVELARTHVRTRFFLFFYIFNDFFYTRSDVKNFWTTSVSYLLHPFNKLSDFLGILKFGGIAYNQCCSQ
ncbi:endoribonuclease Dicer-like protein 3a [Iris pallida]|uniref:Endoribonuclease Dicer-like protein 3a n=1 Tax=Iris pallida TaxID=29817 RepID=A0AAX6DKM7_IRIPA|nr:endoribonuclease Dicer-like protein 3a [Iris pallida]